MKALLRKEYYILGGKKTLLLFIALIALPAILLNWSAIPAALMIGFCTLPYSLSAKDDNARWWTYSKTLPYSRGQIVDAKYLFQLLLILMFGLVLLLEYAVSFLLHPDHLMSPFFALYLFFVLFLISALSFPAIFWTKRHGKNWLTAVVIAVIGTPLLLLTFFMLPTILLNLDAIANTSGEVPLTFIVIGGQRYQITQTVVRHIIRIAKWIVPPFSLVLYGLSWYLSRRIFCRKYDRRTPKEYSPCRQQDDADTIAVMQTMFLN